MRNIRLGWGVLLIAVVTAVVAALTVPSAAGTATLKTLYRFCNKGAPPCTDGAYPEAGLIMDGAGNLYGTTAGWDLPSHTKYGQGTVFELTPDAGKTRWTQTVLYSFCMQGGTNCTDGAHPLAGVIMDGSGNLYGTTTDGGTGAAQAGTAFELTPTSTGTWTHKILYSFCAQGGTNCADGAYPEAGMIMDGAGNLYGTTSGGGTGGDRYGDGGTVFELTPDAGKTTWTETVLYSFCAKGGTNCTDGAGPDAGVIMDASGNLYGTTFNGGTGAVQAGTAFELTPATGIWIHKTLYSFCSRGADCADGAYPEAGLIMDLSGKLYGTTSYYGAYSGGTAFELTPDAATGRFKHKILYSFCSTGDCADGSSPRGLIMGKGRELYGTTYAGGAEFAGTVFELTPDSGKTTWAYNILHSFCAQGGTNCTDGAGPDAGLIMDASGNLYGTTEYGRDVSVGIPYRRWGTVFELRR